MKWMAWGISSLENPPTKVYWSWREIIWTLLTDGKFNLYHLAFSHKSRCLSITLRRCHSMSLVYIFTQSDNIKQLRIYVSLATAIIRRKKMSFAMWLLYCMGCRIRVRTAIEVSLLQIQWQKFDNFKWQHPIVFIEKWSSLLKSVKNVIPSVKMAQI